MSIFFSVINSTYQPNDPNGSTEEDILYQNDASFSAKLVNLLSHRYILNNSVNTKNNNSKNTIHNNNSNNNINSRYNNTMHQNSSKNNRINNNDKLEMNKYFTSQTIGESISNRNKGRSISDKQSGNKNEFEIDSNQYDEDDDNDDIDYNGNNISGSESIVIKIGDKNATTTEIIFNSDVSAIHKLVATNERNITNDTNTDNGENNVEYGTTNTPIITSTSTIAAPANYMNNFNNDYYSKDDMSIYDDVNNNRLNLRNSNGHVNAYEQRNIYVGNELNENVANANDTVKSYIHIEVYKGNLDDLTTKIKESVTIKPSTALNVATATTKIPITSNKASTVLP